MHSQPDPLTLLLFPLSFVALWVGVIFIISHAGWRKFAERYPAPPAAAGAVYLLRRAQFGSLLGSYRNVVQVRFTEAGMRFSVLFLFRPFHPPFLLPWTSVKKVEPRDFLFVHWLRVTIDDACGTIRMLLPAKAESERRRYF